LSNGKSLRCGSIAASIVVLLALASVPVTGLEPGLDQSEDSDVGGYDVLVTLRETGPTQCLELDRSDGSLLVTFGTRATRVESVDGQRSRALGVGPAASAGDVRIKRRMPMIEISQGGRVLLRTWSRRPLAGLVGPVDGAALEDLIVQPLGEPYFDYGFADLEGTDGIWETLLGSWKLGVYRDDLFQRDHGDLGPFGSSWYEATSGPALTVAGMAFWEDYRARVAVLAAVDVRTGLVFYCQDEHNYALLSVVPGATPEQSLAQLTVVVDGVETPVAEQTITWKPGTWYELSVEAVGERVTCAVSGSGSFGAILPRFTGGMVGLYADRPGSVKFDDVSVRPLGRIVDAFDRPKGLKGLAECWEPQGGRWTRAKGRLKGTGRMARCERVGVSWGSTAVSAEVLSRKGDGGVFLNWDGDSGYALTVGKTEYRLKKIIGGEETVLRSGPVAARGPVPVELSWIAGRLQFSVGGEQSATYDFDAPRGTCGLLVDGAADFTRFAASQTQPRHPVISTVTGGRAYVPGAREGSRRHVLGYVWRPAHGRWMPHRALTDTNGTEPWIAVKARGDKTPELWYFQQCPGDAVMSASACSIPADAVARLMIACEPGDAASGYALELAGGESPQLKLLRKGETVAERQVAARELYDLDLWRDGDTVVASVGDEGVWYEDSEPLTGGSCGAQGVGPVAFSRLTLAHRKALTYAFRDVETDWQPGEGSWTVHTGMACIAWDYWLTGRGSPVAMTYNIHPQPADLQVDFSVSEYTQGYSDGRHVHFPYHDISLVTCASERSRDSGYRFVIGADGGQTTRLLRLGKVVAETHDRRFSIRMGGHCNSPRSIHVVVSQRGGEITLRLNDVEALSFTDPEPLGAGLVGLGVEGCTANFRDFWLAQANGGQ